MRAVVQRVLRAQVAVKGEVISSIGRGLVLLVGIGVGDDEPDADYLAGKVVGLRIFDDEQGKMNLSPAQVKAGILAVSQFTLYGDVRRGRRPSFDAAASPQKARGLYEYFVGRIHAEGLPCETGQFQTHMQVELVNDGPVTILLDSAKTF
jgi:D-tyrosyl-tRNA(Tyr) deacylase